VGDGGRAGDLGAICTASWRLDRRNHAASPSGKVTVVREVVRLPPPHCQMHQAEPDALTRCC
jgi:hypothetical protein